MSTIAFAARWQTFDVLPPENGRYAVCHRGRQFGNAYFLNGEWIQRPSFGPTHWLDGGYDRLHDLPINLPRMEEQLGYTPKTVY